MGGGIYIASTQNLTVTHNLPNSVRPNHETRSDRICELGETDSVQNVNVRIFGGTDMQLGGTDVLGLGHNLISVRPIT